MGLEVSRLARQQLLRLHARIKAGAKLTGAPGLPELRIDPSLDEIASAAIDRLHRQVFGGPGAPGTTGPGDGDSTPDQSITRVSGAARSQGAQGGTMKLALQVQKYAGWETVSHHEDATAAEAAWFKEFGFDPRAQGRIVEVGSREVVALASIDSRPAPRVVQQLGYPRS